MKFFHLLTGTCGLGLLTRNWKFYSASDLDGTIRVRRMAEIPGNKHLLYIWFFEVLVFCEYSIFSFFTNLFS